ncbi:MAG: sporulation integral membrane protein YtvI [Defluviitaleaceae bacterium]|nr:sporulation integral membrane protein YtvI [Defluviitaleaceae bacterium]
MRTWFQDESVRPYFRLLYRILITIVTIFILYHTLPVLVSFFLPFIAAFLVASVFNPLICFLQKKWNASRRILSVLMMLVVVLFIASILAGFIYALVREIVALAQNIDAVLEYFGQSLQILWAPMYWVMDIIPADAEEMMLGLIDSLMVWLQTQGTAFADAVVANTVAVTTRVGGGVVSVVIFIMASYFMMSDYPKLTEKVRKLFTPKAYRGYSTLRDAALSALGRYLRAQLLLAFIVFLVSLFGLLIIRQDFALLLAFLFGVIDFLPLIGTAIVLVPWGIVNILTGSVGRGIYLITMSFVIFLLRRIIEPKIVSSQMGLSPLGALASIYIGMRLGGVLGLILGPIIAMVCISLYKAGVLEGWIKDINAVIDLSKRRKL